MSFPNAKGLQKWSPFFFALVMGLFVDLSVALGDSRLAHPNGSSRLTSLSLGQTQEQNRDPSHSHSQVPAGESTGTKSSADTKASPLKNSQPENSQPRSSKSKNLPPKNSRAESSEAEKSPTKKRASWGLGLGFGWLPNYSGSRKSDFQYLPFPIYTGDRFRIDRMDGVSGRVGNTSRVKLSWSFLFQFPIDAEDIEVRRGMTDLDWFFGFGPMVKYTLWKQDKRELFLRVPVRPNFCTDFHSQFQFCGLDISPGIRYVHEPKGLGQFMYRLEAYSYTKEYYQYYHGVPAQFATPDRPAFEARAGFLGFVWGVVHTLPMRSWDLVTMVTFYDYSQAVSRDSPLFESPFNWALFFGVTVDLF